MTLILREDDVRRLLTMPDTIEVLEQAFGALAEEMAMNRPRNRLVTTHGVLHLLAAAAPTFGVMGFKTYTASHEGTRYVVMLFSSHNGRLLAIIEADWLGRMRTGGTSALATKYMARADATTVGLIGAGNQAAMQLLGMRNVRNLTSVSVYSRRSHERELFCEEMSRLLHIPIQPATSAREAVEYADIVITATTSPDPVIRGEWLKPGCHINAIGSNWPQRREIDISTLQRSYLIVTDSKEQARAEAGDLIIPVSEGLFDWNSVYELADVVGGQGLQRELPDDITLYKGLGIALEDVVTAAHVYNQALEKGVGQEIPLLS